MMRTRPSLFVIKLGLLIGSIVHVLTATVFEGYVGCRCAMSRNDILVDEYDEDVLRSYDPTLDIDSYGFGCLAHDLNTSACSTPEEPSECENVVPRPSPCPSTVADSWCSGHWCYVVNNSQCNVVSHTSRIFESRNYSYATCGDLDKFSGRNVGNLLRGKVLKVGMRSNTGGWKGAYHPSGNKHPMVRDGNWYGPIVQLMNQIADQAGFTINYTDIPDFVLERSGSNNSFTQCVYATGLGYLDFCVAMFTVTSDRLAMANMYTIQTEPFYLLSGELELSLWDQFSRVLRPFKGEVWVAVAVVLVIVPLAMLLQDRLYQFMSGELSNKKPSIGQVLETIWLGFRSFTDQCVLHETEGWGSKVSSLSLGIFVMLTLAMYMANLTNILVSSNASTQFTDINDAIRKGSVICTEALQVHDIQGVYPSAKIARDVETGLLGLQSRNALFEYYEQGLCSSIVTGLSTAESHFHEEGSCDLRIVGLPVLYSYEGIPYALNPELKTIPYVLQTMINRGVWSLIKESNRPDIHCSSSSSLQDHSFGLIEMSGIFMLTGFVLLCGFGVSARHLFRYAGKTIADSTTVQSLSPARTVLGNSCNNAIAKVKDGDLNEVQLVDNDQYLGMSEQKYVDPI